MAIDTSGFPLPKPRHRDGLVKLSPAKYRKLKEETWDKQNRRCAQKKCRVYISAPQFAQLHHREGRGMGGGKRDDRDTELLCNSCHAKIHNQ